MPTTSAYLTDRLAIHGLRRPDLDFVVVASVSLLPVAGTADSLTNLVRLSDQGGMSPDVPDRFCEQVELLYLPYRQSRNYPGHHHDDQH